MAAKTQKTFLKIHALCQKLLLQHKIRLLSLLSY